MTILETDEEANDWVETRPVGLMGLGLCARKDIPEGTQFIVEAPLIKVPTPFNLSNIIDALVVQPKPQRRELDRLYWDPGPVASCVHSTPGVML
jgi:hypothetical protein